MQFPTWGTINQGTITTNGQPMNLPGSTTFAGLSVIIKTFYVVIELVMVFGLIFFFVNMVFGGYQWIMSSGDKNALTKAKNTIINSVIGIGVIFCAFAIVGIFQVFFGTDLGISTMKATVTTPTP